MSRNYPGAPASPVRRRALAIIGRFYRKLLMFLGVAVATGSAFLPIQRSAAGGQLVSITSESAGKTPFIHLVKIHLDDASLLDHVIFRIAPKPGSVTRAISARYSSAYLLARADADIAHGDLTVPVFGLYQDYANTVNLTFGFVDGTTQLNTLSIPAAHFASAVLDHPAVVVQARTADTSLSYDFMLLKTDINPHSPTIVDTDGEIRWVGTALTSTMITMFLDNSFFLIAGDATTLLRNEFDGSFREIANYIPANVLTFDHNLDYGKFGILASFTTPEYTESTVMEVDTSGNILHVWDLAKIITAAMIAGGDDPAKFVPASGSLVDWFHTNSSTYRPSDDSLIVSSRENFVIALDYETGAIKWILGDPTKQWYEFPSLRKYALTGMPGTHYPIGQHAVSFYDDKLLLFDDGYGSATHVPTGKNRLYSAPRKYSIDQGAGTATEIWRYLAVPFIFSPLESSVYEDQPGNYLIDYAVADAYTFAELIGLNSSGAKVFDYKYTEVDGGATAWNAVPIHLENLVFN